MPSPAKGSPYTTMTNFFPVNFLMLEVSVRPVGEIQRALLYKVSDLLSLRAISTLFISTMAVNPSFLNSDTDA